jgi:hypothetical protein
VTAMTVGKVRHLDRRRSGEERARDGGVQRLRLGLGTARCWSGMHVQSSVVVEKMERRWWHGGDDPWRAQTGLCWEEGNGESGGADGWVGLEGGAQLQRERIRERG